MSRETPEVDSDTTEPVEPNPPESRPVRQNASQAAKEPRVVRLTHVIGLATALIGLVTAALVFWQVYLTPEQTQADGGDITSAPSTTEQIPTTPAPATTGPLAASESPEAAETRADDPAASEPTEGNLPDVTGMQSIDAREYLEELGFTNVVLYDDDHSWFGAKPDHCTVREQNPQGGGSAAFDTEVRLGYYNDPWADADDLCT